MSDSMPLLVGILKATAVVLLAMGITVALRRAAAGARYVVWLATLVVLLLVPAMTFWAPLRFAVLPATRVSPDRAQSSVADANAVPAAPATAPDVPSASAAAVPGEGPTSTRPSLAVIMLGAWLAVGIGLLTWLALGVAKVRRILRHARPLPSNAWLTPLYETADRLELDDVPRLVMSDAIEMPFACSLRRPTIVLPASAESWTDERRRVVLFHELAHILRRDLVGHTLGRIVCAVYWFHPLVWSAAKRLRAESERACDDLVLASGARPSDYAGHLLDIVTGVRRQGAPATALPMAEKREFEGRMLAILDPGVRRATPSRAQQSLLATGLAALALSVAAVAPVRRDVPGSGLADAASAQLTDARTEIARRLVQNESVTTTSSRTNATTTARVSSSQLPGGPMQPPQPVQQAAPEPMAAPTPQLHTFVQSLVRQITGAQQQERVDTALLAAVLRTDRDAGVRKAAAWALQGRRDAVPLLVERLRVDEDESVREMAAWALAGHSTTSVIAALSEALRRDRSDEVRATAAWALGNMGGRADLAPLVVALDDENADVRQRALWAIGQRDLDNVPPRVLGMLKDSDGDVRMMAAWLVGQHPDRGAIPAVREAFLAEQDPNVAQGLIRALLFMGDRSQAVIDRAMASEDPEMRARGVRMIAGQGPGVWPWPWPWPQPRPSP